jgi:hypothetical protein
MATIVIIALGAVIVGDAKKKLESVRKAFLAGLEEWAFQPTEWEAQTVAEIQDLPMVKVHRYPNDALAYMRMPAQHCHKNAEFMEKNDPTGRTRHVTGWWLNEGSYVLHSVIHYDGQYACVTPAPAERDNTFDFVPDSKIEWQEEGEYRAAYRDGVGIGKGVRIKPAETLKELEIIRQRLLSGINPYEAVRR